jgi:hypothetical protein
MVRFRSLEERIHLDSREKDKLKEKLRQLCVASNLPVYMGELFLAEIKLSTDEANRHLRERVKMLGLWD